ncbi:putative phosphohydrolase, MPP superfamily [Halanaeroarchaeum sp. HSR-CO]|uniref:metallophosphoesterase n=1 Tax=Halanaeroarchaeum sp. HSR-CO TaxID=2866382 RepID=UPI00217D3918|nr:metallophosphoesterase [Halanaeroarchaeum sp. HSR-CO]UWG47470.1 putative phosphohydrolase, MPP superfamily [Halanaeroarchaeum sp. HSR-CO]
MSTGGVRIVDRAAYVTAADALIVADLHLGQDRSSAVELPVGEHDDILGRLETTLQDVEPATVVLAGDLLHSFDRVPTGVSETLGDIRRVVDRSPADLVVLEGNHDTMLSTLVEAPIQSAHRLADGTVVVHGHREPIETADRFVVGHEHPAIRIEGRRYPCALDCSNQQAGNDVFVLPAYTRLARGTLVNDLDAGESLSPLLTDLGECRPIVSLDDEPLEFPPLTEFRSLL